MWRRTRSAGCAAGTRPGPTSLGRIMPAIAGILAGMHVGSCTVAGIRTRWAVPGAVPVLYLVTGPGPVRRHLLIVRYAGWRPTRAHL